MFQALKKMFGGKKEPVEVLSPVDGKVVALSEVADPTFAQEIFGKGVAVIPSEREFRAPISGEVAVMFETGHAVSIKGDNGADPCSRLRCHHTSHHLQIGRASCRERV